MLNVILIGPQGCGKGTQAERLVRQFYLTHIEAGGMIRARAEIHDKKAAIIDHLVNKKGELLPDGIVLDMICDEMEENPSETGYLFDGFPRTPQQYQALKEVLEEKGLALSHGLYITISEEESLKRLGSRRLCQKCHKGYSLILEPTRQACDCGGKLLRRVDDEPQAIKKRLSLFHQSTQPILELMKQDGILVEINGEQSIEAIFEEIRKRLSK